MKLPLLGAGSVYTGPDVFRSASLFLYGSLLLQILILEWMGRPGLPRSVNVSLFVTAAVTAVALIRLFRPALQLVNRWHVLLELLAAGAAIEADARLPVAAEGRL